MTCSTLPSTHNSTYNKYMKDVFNPKYSSDHRLLCIVVLLESMYQNEKTRLEQDQNSSDIRSIVDYLSYIKKLLELFKSIVADRDKFDIIKLQDFFYDLNNHSQNKHDLNYEKVYKSMRSICIHKYPNVCDCYLDTQLSMEMHICRKSQSNCIVNCEALSINYEFYKKLKDIR